MQFTAEHGNYAFCLGTGLNTPTAHAATNAGRQGSALLFDEADDFGANGAEPRNTHFQGCDHDETYVPGGVFLGTT